PLVAGQDSCDEHAPGDGDEGEQEEGEGPDPHRRGQAPAASPLGCRAAAGRTSAIILQTAMRARPNTHTIVAPVGMSKYAEATIPRRLTDADTLHPSASRLPHRLPQATPASPGTIRKAKTRRTPAILTALVTTTPNEA